MNSFFRCHHQQSPTRLSSIESQPKKVVVVVVVVVVVDVVVVVVVVVIIIVGQKLNFKVGSKLGQ